MDRFSKDPTRDLTGIESSGERTFVKPSLKLRTARHTPPSDCETTFTPASTHTSFAAIDFGEMTRLCLIVVSSAVVATAGYFAQAEALDGASRAVASATTDDTLSAKAQNEARNKELKLFAENEIQNSEKLLSKLAKDKSVSSTLPQPVRSQLSAASEDLEEQVENAKRSLAQLSQTGAAQKGIESEFAREDIKGNLIALQESAAEASALLERIHERMDTTPSRQPDKDTNLYAMPAFAVGGAPTRGISGL